MKKSILASTPFFIINKYFLLKLGIDASLVLSDLIQKEQYFKESCQDNDGFFFNVTNDISCSTTLSYYQIKQALSILEKWNIIKVVLKGVPAKKHFKIDHNQISNFLRTSNAKNEELECQNFNNKIVNSLNSINNNKEIKIKKNNDLLARGMLFSKSIAEMDLNIDQNIIKDFIDYWTEDNGKKMRFEMEKTWNTNLRLKRWVRNQKNFNRGNNANNMPDFLDSAYLNRIKEDQSQVNKFYKHLVENCGYEKIETATGYIRYRKRV